MIRALAAAFFMALLAKDVVAQPPETKEPSEKVEKAFHQYVEWRLDLLYGRATTAQSWQQNISYANEQLEETTDPFARDLIRRGVMDSIARFNVMVVSRGEMPEGVSIELNDTEFEAFEAMVMDDLTLMDRANTEHLKEHLSQREGWWTISEVGPHASFYIWLITQHSDQDRAFQKRALELTQPLVSEEEIKPSNYAFLVDRVAVAEDRPQTYGTQGACMEDVWKPGSIEDPEDVDKRRADAGIMPFATYVERMQRFCAPVQAD